MESAFRLMKEAKTAESKGLVDVAYDKYVESAKIFLSTVSGIEDEASRALIGKNVERILTRAERLKASRKKTKNSKSASEGSDASTRVQIPKAPGDDADEIAAPPPNEDDIETRFKHLRGDKNTNISEDDIADRFAKLKGRDPIEERKRRDMEALERKRWLAGLGGPKKKATTEEQEAALLAMTRDRVSTIRGSDKADPLPSTDGANLAAFAPLDEDDDDDRVDAEAIAAEVGSLLEEARAELTASGVTRDETTDDDDRTNNSTNDNSGTTKKDKINVGEDDVEALRSLVARGILTEAEYKIALEAKRLHRLSAETAETAATLTSSNTTLPLNIPEAPTAEPKIEDAKRFTIADKMEMDDERNDFRELLGFLRTCGLERLYGTLHANGIACVLDLDDLDPDELYDMGIDRREYVTLRNALRRYEW